MATPKATPPIAVIGMAARLPGAGDVDQYWHNLLAGVESIDRASGTSQEGPVPPGGQVRAVGKVADIELFDADHFRIPPAEALVMDPQHRVLLEVATAALEDAGYRGPGEEVVGVFVGSGENFYYRDFVAPREGGGEVGSDPKVLAGNAPDFLASRIAFKLGLTGPSITVQTACATGLTAVAQACSALALGDCDIAIAGGVSLLMPDVEGYTYQPGSIFSADGHCRAFDADATGTVPSSGAAVVVLRRDDDARASRDRRRAVIRGWAVNNDGGTSAGFMAPSPAGQEMVVRAALARANMSPDAVGYVETHGTATPIGDPIELEALRRVFGTPSRPPRSCVLGAVKTNLGHTDVAAGVAGLIKAALATEHGIIPATLHFDRPTQDLTHEESPFQVSAEAVTWGEDVPRVAGVSAFGLGGNNAHVVLEQVDRTTTGGTRRARQVVTLSARTEAELLEVRARLREWVTSRLALDPPDLADLAFTLALGRPQLACRWACTTASSTELAGLLEDPVASEPSSRRWSLSLAGTPDDLVEMARRQLAEEPVFGEVVDDLAPDLDLDAIPPERAGALAAMAVLVALERMGMTFGRVDAPRWARPVLSWWDDGHDFRLVEQVLAACTPDPDLSVVREGSSRIIVGKDFEFGAALGRAWAQGARIDWGRFYAVEQRGRIPLPTYPFARRRFWLGRPEPAPRPDAESTGVAATGNSADDVLAQVELVWKSVLGLDAVGHDDHFVDDLGGDSLYAVDIGAALCDAFQVDLPIDLPFEAPTVAEAAAYIRAVLDSGAPTTTAAT